MLLNLIETLEHDAMACAYIDLNAFPDIRSFASALASLTTEALETNKDKLLKMFSGFQKLRPKVTVEPDGTISAGLEIAVEEKEIRNKISSRTTDLLKRVFALQD